MRRNLKGAETARCGALGMSRRGEGHSNRRVLDARRDTALWRSGVVTGQQSGEATGRDDRRPKCRPWHAQPERPCQLDAIADQPGAASLASLLRWLRLLSNGPEEDLVQRSAGSGWSEEGQGWERLALRKRTGRRGWRPD